MDVDEAISGRRSVREYTTQAVEGQTIYYLINAAILAPNAVNQQPWTFTVVRDQGLLDRISRGAKSHMLMTMPASPHSDHFRSLLNEPNQIFYRARLGQSLAIVPRSLGVWNRILQLHTEKAHEGDAIMILVLRRSSSVIRRTYHRRSRARSRKFAGSANGYLLLSYGRNLVAV